MDVSIQLSNDSGFPTGKKKKKIALTKIGIALQTKGNFFVAPCSCDHDERSVLLCICLISLLGSTIMFVLGWVRQSCSAVA